MVYSLLSPYITLSPLSPPSSTVHQEKAQGRNAHYKLTSTVMLWLQTIKAGSGTMNLGGSLTRQNEQDYAVNDASPHIANIGRMVEVRALYTSSGVGVVVLITALVLFHCRTWRTRFAKP